MDTMTIVAMVVIVAAVLLAIGSFMWWSSQKKSERLRENFGDEYDRTVAQSGDRRAAEKELTQRQERIEKLRIKPLTADECNTFLDQWHKVQGRFVDDPKSALHDADDLVGKVMEKRGYPVGDFEQRAADVSVDHPDVVTNYRLAHNISKASDQGNATTEEMRQAMQSYRSLFDDLLQTAEVRR